MYSKVKFDIGEEYLPCIVAEIRQSDDVRDKIAKGFKERFGFDSNLCHVEFKETCDDNGQVIATQMIINPISLDDAKNHIKTLSQ